MRHMNYLTSRYFCGVLPIIATSATAPERFYQLRQ
jgi:hypothetical protein